MVVRSLQLDLFPSARGGEKVTISRNSLFLFDRSSRRMRAATPDWRVQGKKHQIVPAKLDDKSSNASAHFSSPVTVWGISVTLFAVSLIDPARRPKP